MFKVINRGLKNKKGFTMVELMVVVVIIGILSAIAVPVYNNVTKKAERSAVEANLRIIDGAIEMYRAVDGKEPDDINSLLGDDEDDGYLKSKPTGPANAEYSINDGRAVVSGEVGGETLNEKKTLEELPWRDDENGASE